MRRLACTVAGLLVAAGSSVASAAGAAPTFSGSCSFSGTIHPEPPITILPHPSPRFSYAGTGTCAGSAGGRAVTRAPLSVRFRHAATPFDTCELGLDVGITGSMWLRVRHRTIAFPITVDLLRAAVAGPLRLTAVGGGEAVGTAQFTPASPVNALTQCGGAGVASATLAASFSTVQALVGR